MEALVFQGCGLSLWRSVRGFRFRSLRFRGKIDSNKEYGAIFWSVHIMEILRTSNKVQYSNGTPESYLWGHFQWT